MADLVTVADLKELLSIAHAEDDELLARLVSAASEYFERQVGRRILSAEYVEIRDGDGGRSIVPSNYPITAVTSLEVNGEPIDESATWSDPGWYQDGDVVRLRGTWVTSGQGNVVLTYTAGYSTTPEDVRQAVLEMAALMYREKDRVGQQSRTGPDGSTVFYYAPPARVVATIEAYRRVL